MTFRIMKTEKDIRKFMQDNRIQVPKDDRFMEDLIRQINLLPVPASFDGSSEDRIMENQRLLEMIRQAMKRRYRRQALVTLLLDVAIMSALFMAVYLFVMPQMPYSSPVVQALIQWRYALLGVVGLGVLSFSMSKTGLLRI